MPGLTNAERLAVYTHLRTFESDFDKSQSQIRAICAAWSAAVVGAIALIVTSALTPPIGMAASDIVHRAEVLTYLRSLVCIIGSAGVFAFWFIDQRIYQRLLHSVFTYGLFVELKNPDLPQIRSSLFIANLDITSGLAWFYRMQFWIFLVIGAVFVWQPFSINLGPVPPGIKSLTWVHLAGAIGGELVSDSWPSLGKIVEILYPALRDAMPERGAAKSWTGRLFRPQIFWHQTHRLSTPENDRRWDAWVARIRSSMDPPPRV
jgi:hypothetical protein